MRRVFGELIVLWLEELESFVIHNFLTSLILIVLFYSSKKSKSFPCVSGIVKIA